MFGDLCQDVCEPGLRIGLRQRVPEGAAAAGTAVPALGPRAFCPAKYIDGQLPTISDLGESASGIARRSQQDIRPSGASLRRWPFSPQTSRFIERVLSGQSLGRLLLKARRVCIPAAGVGRQVAKNMP